jgi:hypothetical protein
VGSDRVILITVIQQCDEFIENLVSKILELTYHHFSPKQQARYLKESKENLPSDQCIILADFSDNYLFILQDAIKGSHWANNQAVHQPFPIYIRDQHLQAFSFCE